MFLIEQSTLITIARDNFDRIISAFFHTRLASFLKCYFYCSWAQIDLDTPSIYLYCPSKVPFYFYQENHPWKYIMNFNENKTILMAMMSHFSVEICSFYVSQ